MYVISVKRIVDYGGNILDSHEQYFEYFMYDRYSGSMSTGYPCFGRLHNAERFESVEKAIETFNKQLHGLKLTVRAHQYDMSTLAVRKISFSTKAKLQFNEV